DLPRGYQWLKIVTRRPTSVESVRELPRAWKTDVTSTRMIGDRWLARARTPLLRVPSVLAPESFNYLLNPAHPRGMRAARVATAFPYPLDPRLARPSREAETRPRGRGQARAGRGVERRSHDQESGDDQRESRQVRPESADEAQRLRSIEARREK